MRAKQGQRARRSGGFTLVELLVVMIILSIVTTMIIGTWIALARGYSTATQAAEQRDNAQLAVERLSRELRDVQIASNVTGATGAAILASSLGPYQIQFNTSFNSGTQADPLSPSRLVRYYLSSGVLYRQLAGADRAFGTADDQTRVLVDHVVNAAQGRDMFRYYWYDGSGNLVHSSGSFNLPTSTVRIKEIRIRLMVDLNPGHSPNYMEIRTMIQPRNQRNF